MHVNMRDVYKADGSVKEDLTPWLSGHRHHTSLLPNLEWLDQSIQCQQSISLHETAQAGLYFSLLAQDDIRSVDDIQTIQITHQARTVSGDVTLKPGQHTSLMQARISPALLAAVLGETEDHILQHFSAMTASLSNEKGIIQLPITPRTTALIQPILTHSGHAISLAGHLYTLIFSIIEQLQMLSHLSKCEDCQSKLFQAQNLLETPNFTSLNIRRLAQQVGLNAEALAIGFHLITGQTIEHYCLPSRIQSAAAQIRQNPASKQEIVSQSGFSDAQFEAAFIEHFGVYSHQYGPIH
ncbi:AraC family transcriptional regulator [Marinomonas sp. A79]|uniref:AraC family transcriptional regulator n=1 Tax=Marinomonas vulgaris TaxID=2823372 RepID=A0ABS5H8P2_9GAMM|nr:AraC family transcriptional regulator [Marinomonas vulgaris]MBR7887807.1 AraC family transcriptional regulator [Marinomonas vulgaris]